MKSLVAALSLTSGIAFAGPVSTNLAFVNRGPEVATEAGLSYRLDSIELGLGYGMPGDKTPNYLIPSLTYITPVSQGLNLATSVGASITEGKSKTEIRLSQSLRVNITEHLKATLGAQYEQGISPVVGYQYSF